ncbi:hypothetical protein [Streptomyces sp. SBT349]|uniref:hypothetical protein n=1 Tax=Streptomyces sp. SBT349 TaxID=1580539 RepID=UPI00066CB117|nr:hypothetical protein [Streptomyces sp. SBT349]
MTVSTEQWHASPDPNEPPIADAATGEVRVPLALYLVDQQRGRVPLVLSRADAEQLCTVLRRALGAAR